MADSNRLSVLGIRRPNSSHEFVSTDNRVLQLKLLCVTQFVAYPTGVTISFQRLC